MTRSPQVDPVRISIACLLAWAVPGAGHFFLGRRVKGMVFLAIVLVTFMAGLAFQGRVYLANPEQPLSYLATFANLALGPLDVIAREVSYDRIIYFFPRETDRDLYQ